PRVVKKPYDWPRSTCALPPGALRARRPTGLQSGSHTTNAGAAFQTPTPGKSKLRANRSSPSAVALPHAIALEHAGIADAVARRASERANGPRRARAASDTQFWSESMTANVRIAVSTS